MEMHPWYMFIDPCLIWFYRLTGYALVDFLVGTFVVAFIAQIIGESTISLAFLASRKYVDGTTDEVVRYQNLAMDALSAGNKEAYRAANKLANDAFGRSFFMQIAFSAARLWPIFFAVDWMGHRFSGLEFGVLFTDYSVGYICIFIALYAAAYIIFKRIKYKLPYFRNIKAILDSYQERTERMKGFGDLASAHDQTETGPKP